MFYFLFLNQPHVGLIISFPFRGKLALSQLSPHFTPLSPSLINLFHHLPEELVFPLRQHVILPTHNIKQCPCTTITLRLCPLPAHSSQCFSSLQIKEQGCLSLFSLSSFLFWLSPARSFRVKGCYLFTKIKFSIFHLCLLQCHPQACFKWLFSHVRNIRGRSHGWISGLIDDG